MDRSTLVRFGWLALLVGCSSQNDIASNDSDPPRDRPSGVWTERAEDLQQQQDGQGALKEDAEPSMTTPSTTEPADPSGIEAMEAEQPPTETKADGKVPFVLKVADAPPIAAAFSGEEMPADQSVSEEVQRALEQYDEADFDKLKEIFLTYPHAESRKDALWHMVHWVKGHDADIVSLLRTGTQDPSDLVRGASLDLLWDVQTSEERQWDISSAMGEVVPFLQSDHSHRALTIIKASGPDAGETMPMLMQLLEDDDFIHGDLVIETIGGMGDYGRQATKQLSKIAVTSYGRSEAAALALGKLGEEKPLLEATKHKDSWFSDRAIRGLSELPAKSPWVVNALIEATKSESNSAKKYAVPGLCSIQPPTEEVTQALLTLMKDKDSFVRAEVYENLPNMKPLPPELLSALVDAAGNEEPGYSKNKAKDALANCDGADEIRLNLLLKDVEERDGSYFGIFGDGGPTFFPMLKKMAVDPELPVRRRISALIGLELLAGELDLNLDGDDGEQLADLARKVALEKDEPHLYIAAIDLLMRVRGANPDYDVYLEAVSTDGPVVTYREAIDMLCSARKPEALPKLQALIENGNPKLLETILRQVRVYEDNANSLVPAIINVELDPKVFDETESIRTVQLETLAAIGTQRDLIEPFAKKVMAEVNPESYFYARVMEQNAALIAKFDLPADDLVAAIKKQLEEAPSDQKRARWIPTLVKLGPKAASLTPLVASYLQSEDYDLKTDSVDALVAFGPAAKEAVPQLIECIKTWEYPSAPIQALGAIEAGGPEFAKLAPKLLENIDNRFVVLNTIAKLGPAAKDAIPAITPLLSSTDNSDVENAIIALGAMGAEAKSTVPQLIKTAQENDAYGIPDTAVAALAKIDPANPAVVELGLGLLDLENDEAVEKFLTNLGENAPAVLKQGLQSESPKVKANSLALLDKIEISDDQKREISQTLLDDEDESVRAKAAQQLFALGDRSEKILSLAFIAEMDDQSGRQNQKLWMLRRAVTPQAIDYLLSADIEDHQRSDAMGWLDSTVPPQYTDRFQKLYDALASEDAVQRTWSAIALSQLGDRSDKVMDILVQAASEEGPAQLSAIYQMPYYELISPETQAKVDAAMLMVMNTGSPEIAGAARQTLQRSSLESPATREALAVMLEKEETVVPAAHIVSAKLKDFVFSPKAVETLASQLGTSDDEVGRYQRRENIRAIGKCLFLAGPTGVEKLVEGIRESELSEELRLAALTANIQNRYGGQELEPLDPAVQAALKPLLESDDLAIATTAAMLLALGDAADIELAPKLLAGLPLERYDFTDVLVESMLLRKQEADVIVPALIKQLPDMPEQTQSQVGRLLAESDNDSQELTVVLIDTLAKMEEDYSRSPIARHFNAAQLTELAKRIDTEEDSTVKARLINSYMTGITHQARKDEPFTQELVPALTKGLQSPDEAVKRESLFLLAVLKPDAPELLPPLQAMLKQPPENWDWRLSRVLGEMKEHAAPVVPRLQEVLQSKTDEAAMAMGMLHGIGPAAEPAVDDIVAALEDQEMNYDAMEALRLIGPAAKGAGPKIDAMLPQTESLVEIAQTIIKIEAPTDALVAEFQRRLDDPVLKYEALSEAFVIEEQFKVTPIVVEALASEDPEWQLAAARTIRSLDHYDPAYTPPLMKLLDSKIDEQRVAAIGALSTQKEADEQVLTALKAKLDDPSASVQRAAIAGLANYPEQIVDLVPRLVALLNESEQTQVAAIEALGKIGPPAKVALPRLLTLYGSLTDYRKRSLSEAIAKIDTEAAKQAGIELPKE
ncbi:HEAT repeat domain-containing protein [Bremerella cremea]|uniref:HEAT repeat domain-containing protein n=1 Tax=Bremerella cremea TaxID=1031537 RepID=UPI0031E60535